MTATHPHSSHFAPTPGRLWWHGAAQHPALGAVASALGAVVLVIALAMVALASLSEGDHGGTNPPPIPRNNEPSPFPAAP
jgi:hypothetical protein